MEAVYQWIRQIAVFAVISFLVLYLTGNQEKQSTLRFYLSLLMLLLILKPAAALLQFDQILAEKLTEMETDADLSAVDGQIQQAAELSDHSLLDYTSDKALSWIKGLAQDENLELLDGKIYFDEKIMEQSGELVVTGVEITVSGPGKKLAEIQTASGHLQSDIMEAFHLNKSAVSVKAGAQKDDS